MAATFTALKRWTLRVHKWLALAVGLQVLFWFASGLFFTLIPIERVRGEHLRVLPERVVVDVTAADFTVPASPDFPFHTASLSLLEGRPVWLMTGPEGRRLVDAGTGAVLSPLPEETARRLVLGAWVGRGELVSLSRLDAHNAEYKGALPVWQARFEGRDDANLYLDAVTGDVRAVRTPHWVAFDWLWGLHIMDWKNREVFTTWWMKLAAGAALLLTLAGFVLLGLRARQKALLR
jgi:hypothetical protein